MTTISTEELKELCLTALIKTGFTKPDAQTATDHFLENEMSGKASHGIVRIVQTIDIIKKFGLPKAPPTLEHDNGSITTYNAQGNLGTVAGQTATQAAIKNAKTHGIALTGIRNYVSSAGSMTYYLRQIANEGLIAIMGCNSDALVSPPGGRERVIGTNPIGICIPGENGLHMIADLATSAYTYGQVMVHKDKNEQTPPGVMVDATGQSSTNPEDAYKGSILPLAGYKGFSLGLMIELLSGSLIGAKSIKHDVFDNDGLFIISINPEAVGNTAFYTEVFKTLQTIKNSAPAEGQTQVSLPGERSATTLEKAQKDNKINVADETLKKLKALAE